MKLRVPVRFQGADLSKVAPDQFRVVMEYANAIPQNVKDGRGLLLSGPPGVGKTYAIVALTRAYASLPGARRDYEFVTAPDLFERFATFDSEGTMDNRRVQPWRATYESVPWLVINDLGKEYRAGKLDDQVNYKLGRILRARNERKLVTHITTNLAVRRSDGTSLETAFGSSIVSLMAEMMRAAHITGEDRRRQR